MRLEGSISACACDPTRPEVRSPVDDGALPGTVGETILRRVDQLGPEARRMLAVGALLGREFDVAVLAATTRLDRSAVDAAVREAEAAKVVDPLGDGCYRFSHALVQATLDQSIDERRRARLHRRAAEALEQLCEDDPPIAAIAHHLVAALPDGDRARAVQYARRAGDLAARQLADDQAIAHYERALRAAGDRRPGEAPVLSPHDEASLHLALGEAHLRTGRVDRARRECAQAAHLAREIPDHELFARAALSFAGGSDVSIGFEFSGRDDELIAILDEARTGLTNDEAGLRGVVSARLAGARYDANEFAAADRLTSEAVALARQSGDRSALAYTLAARHASIWRRDSLVERLAIAHELATLDAQAGTQLALQGYVWRVADVLECGDYEKADEQVATFDAWLYPGAHARFHWYSKLYHGMRLLLAGRLDEFAQSYEEARALGIRAGAVNVGTTYAVQSFFATRERAELAGVASLLDAFADANPTQAAWRVGAMVSRVEAGEELGECRDALARIAADGFAELPDDGFWLPNGVLLADVATDLDAIDEARALYRVLAPYRDRIAVVSRILITLGSVELALGKLATLLGEPELAHTHLALARAKHELLDAPLLLARTDLADAALRRATGDEPGARAIAQRVAAVADAQHWPAVARRAASF